MASNPTPNCSSVPPRPSNSNNHHQNHNHNDHRGSNKLKETQYNHRHSHRRSCWSTSPFAALAAETGAGGGGSGSSNSTDVGSSVVTPSTQSTASGGRSGTGTSPPSYPSLFWSYLGFRKSRLSPELSGKRSTRFAAKMHSDRPRITPNTYAHTKAAEEALHCLLKAGNDSVAIDNILFSYEHKLGGCNDYVYLLKEFANSGHLLQAEKCYNFGIDICKNVGRVSMGRLTSTMIGTLGRLGRIEQALSLFEDARFEGHGNTVYSFLTMIIAYGRNKCFPDAVELFRSMPTWGIQPNLITYNALIDAGVKGEVDFDTVVKFFDELVADNLKPDRLTYNLLLSACASKGLWEHAQRLLREMDQKGIDRDLFTYNTYLDTLCKWGQIDLAKMVFDEMLSKRVWPSVVTISTMMDGYVKANRLEDALNLHDEMKRRSIFIDRVSYNTLVGIYAKLGRFDEAMDMCQEMERSGIRTHVVTYNALLCGYGKHAMYDEVRRMFEEMKTQNIYPNTLTYSTMIDVYTKGGMFQEAMDVYREFKEAGLEVDVLFYSALVGALCKNGLVESSMMLLDVMIQKGIKPNVITYNSIIDAFGQHSALERGVHSSSLFINGTFQNTMTDEEGDQILKMFEQLVAEKAGHTKKDKRGTQDQVCILWIFRKMHQLNIKPNVVTFSAILNACSRCNSFEDASKLLDELRLFDNQVYGVGHGLLMGYRNQVWHQAESLFDEIERMDSSTASAFYNALTDMLWHFGQRRGAQMVVLEGKQRNVWKCECSISCLDLHLMSSGAACAMVHAWLLDIYTNVNEGHELPQIISILTGWGKHSKVVGDSILKKTIEALLSGMDSPFKIDECTIGRFVSPGNLVATWLTKSKTYNLLVLNDVRMHSNAAGGSSH